MSLSETTLSRQIQDALEAVGVWVVRVPAGRPKRRFHSAPPGTPDLLVLKPYVWLEVKRPKEALLPSQEAWHCRARAEGIRVAIVRSVGDALEAVRAAKAAA